jgi:hypothetical protein
LQFQSQNLGTLTSILSRTRERRKMPDGSRR